MVNRIIPPYITNAQRLAHNPVLGELAYDSESNAHYFGARSGSGTVWQQFDINVLVPWDNSITYEMNQPVRAGTNNASLYVSLTNANIGNDPTTDTTNWLSIAGAGSVQTGTEIIAAINAQGTTSVIGRDRITIAPLNITGAVTANYDGTVAVPVRIPTFETATGTSGDTLPVVFGTNSNDAVTATVDASSISGVSDVDILTVYADDIRGANQSESRGSKLFFRDEPYIDNVRPTLPISSGETVATQLQWVDPDQIGSSGRASFTNDPLTTGVVSLVIYFDDDNPRPTINTQATYYFTGRELGTSVPTGDYFLTGSGANVTETTVASSGGPLDAWFITSANLTAQAGSLQPPVAVSGSGFSGLDTGEAAVLLNPFTAIDPVISQPSFEGTFTAGSSSSAAPGEIIIYNFGALHRIEPNRNDGTSDRTADLSNGAVGQLVTIHDAEGVLVTSQAVSTFTASTTSGANQVTYFDVPDRATLTAGESYTLRWGPLEFVADDDNVRRTGTQTIPGQKNFTNFQVDGRDVDAPADGQLRVGGTIIETSTASDLNVPDDLTIDSNNLLQLERGGTSIGAGVTLALSGGTQTTIEVFARDVVGTDLQYDQDSNHNFSRSVTFAGTTRPTIANLNLGNRTTTFGITNSNGVAFIDVSRLTIGSSFNPVPTVDGFYIFGNDDVALPTFNATDYIIVRATEGTPGGSNIIPEGTYIGWFRGSDIIPTVVSGDNDWFVPLSTITFVFGSEPAPTEITGATAGLAHFNTGEVVIIANPFANLGTGSGSSGQSVTYYEGNTFDSATSGTLISVRKRIDDDHSRREILHGATSTDNNRPLSFSNYSEEIARTSNTDANVDSDEVFFAYTDGAATGLLTIGRIPLHFINYGVVGDRVNITQEDAQFTPQFTATGIIQSIAVDTNGATRTPITLQAVEVTSDAPHTTFSGAAVRTRIEFIAAGGTRIYDNSTNEPLEVTPYIRYRGASIIEATDDEIDIYTQSGLEALERTVENLPFYGYHPLESATNGDITANTLTIMAPTGTLTASLDGVFEFNGGLFAGYIDIHSQETVFPVANSAVLNNGVNVGTIANLGPESDQEGGSTAAIRATARDTVIITRIGANLSSNGNVRSITIMPVGTGARERLQLLEEFADGVYDPAGGRVYFPAANVDQILRSTNDQIYFRSHTVRGIPRTLTGPHGNPEVEIVEESELIAPHVRRTNERDHVLHLTITTSSVDDAYQLEQNTVSKPGGPANRIASFDPHRNRFYTELSSSATLAYAALGRNRPINFNLTGSDSDHTNILVDFEGLAGGGTRTTLRGSANPRARMWLEDSDNHDGAPDSDGVLYYETDAFRGVDLPPSELVSFWQYEIGSTPSTFSRFVINGMIINLSGFSFISSTGGTQPDQRTALDSIDATNAIYIYDTDATTLLTSAIIMTEGPNIAGGGTTTPKQFTTTTPLDTSMLTAGTIYQIRLGPATVATPEIHSITLTENTGLQYDRDVSRALGYSTAITVPDPSLVVILNDGSNFPRNPEVGMRMFVPVAFTNRIVQNEVWETIMSEDDMGMRFPVSTITLDAANVRFHLSRAGAPGNGRISVTELERVYTNQAGVEAVIGAAQVLRFVTNVNNPDASVVGTQATVDALIDYGSAFNGGAGNNSVRVRITDVANLPTAIGQFVQRRVQEGITHSLTALSFYTFIGIGVAGADDAGWRLD